MHRAAVSRAGTRVLKFGGSSVGNSDAVRRVAAVLRHSHAGSPTVGVLSAMFGVTNRLLGAVAAAAAGDKVALARIRGGLLDAHVSVARDLCPPSHAEDACARILASMESRVDAICHDVLGKGAANAYDTDVISSTGESWATQLMSSFMCSSHLHPRGVSAAAGEGAPRDAPLDAPFVDASDVIITDGVSGGARPLLAESRSRTDAILMPILRRAALPLVTGFYGASTRGLLTTLGRGGSDLSAAVLGHCLDATEVALYKVEYTTRPDGWMNAWAPGWVGVVHDADPAFTIPSLHYEEARELAHFSKKVLHPETVSPAVERGIPITVRNTLDPLHPGTLISGTSGGGSDGSHTHVGAGTTSLAAPTAALGGSPAPPPRVLTITRIPLLLYETKNAPIAGVDLSALHNIARGEAALIAIVGLNVMSVPFLETRVTAALSEAGIPACVPARINDSPNNFSVVVPEAARHAAVQLLHRRFVLEER